MTTFEISRTYAHRTYGAIGEVKLAVTGLDKVTLDGAELPERSIEYLLTFALQSLQDAYAGAKNSDEAQAAFAKKLDAIKAGTIGTRSSGGGGVDSFTKVCRSVAREMLRAVYTNSGKPWKEFTELSAETQNEKLDLVIEKKRDVVEAEAKKRIAAKAKLADAVDLADLGL